MTATSIVITNHDHGRFVAQAIDSALAQTHAAVEVVVDDGSTDDSRRIIEGYHDAVRVSFREHGGQARAMLGGFGKSCGEVVLFLDSDDILYPDAISRISSRFGPRIAKVQGRLDLIDERVDTGAPAVTRVVKASDHYERRPMDNLPDLFVEWSGDRPVVRVRTARGDVVEGFYPDYRTGDHREQGAFRITGPGVAARALASPVSITDFAPTIGELLGVPLPGLDGRPIPGVAG